MKEYALYEHPIINTVNELLEICDERYGDKTCFVYSRKTEEVKISYHQFHKEVNYLKTWFSSQGFNNCHMAILGENSYEWILSYFAIVCGSNVVVPLDKDLEADDINELLYDSECKAIIYSKTYEDIIENLKQKVSKYKFISMEKFTEYLVIGKHTLFNNKLKSVRNVNKDSLATIVYTSGTTGKSKGVMLSHYNLISDMHAACQYVTISGASILLLPLHHTFGLVASLFAVMFYGEIIYINNSLKKLMNDFQKVQPQNLFVVPLIVEKIYKNIWTIARQQGKDKLLRKMLKISNVLKKCGIDLRRKFFRSVLEAFGGKLEVIVCGGAPLSVKMIKKFDELGITILNGYGITECAPIVAVNRNKNNRMGSVGFPLKCNEVSIAEDGEILVRGTNVMKGYFHNLLETKLVFRKEWFCTGDIGYLGKHGELYITGRKKNLIILNNGENISAESIEKEIYSIPYVKETIVYEESGKIVAEIYLDEKVLDGEKRIKEDIKKINAKLLQNQNITNVKIRDSEFPKTTTLKIKRERR